MDDFNGVTKPPSVDHQPLIENQVLQKMYGASVGQCRPIVYLFSTVGVKLATALCRPTCHAIIIAVIIVVVSIHDLNLATH